MCDTHFIVSLHSIHHSRLFLRYPKLKNDAFGVKQLYQHQFYKGAMQNFFGGGKLLHF